VASPTRTPVIVAVVAGAMLVLATALFARSRRHLPPPAHPRFARTFELTQFQRGNIHTHTDLSDGHASPEEVARWYRDHGYAFLALTDHNLVAAADLVSRLSTPGFVILPGEEVSMWHHGRQTHINALCTRQTIGGGDFPDAASALKRGIRLVRDQHGVALINHPNFDSAIERADVPHFAGANLIEIASGHGFVNSQGDDTHPSHEQLWDQALSSGLDIMGAAVDDMHCLQSPGDPPAYPGKGWIYASVPVLDTPSLCHALADGLFVSSTGPVLRRVAVTANRYEVQPEDPAAVVVFVGAGGRVLSTGAGAYWLKGDEGYVRARIETSDGGRAWTPAVRVGN
jgi:hypothetical protein